MRGGFGDNGNGSETDFGPIIGIDLGTSTSSIAVLRDGRPELIADKHGDQIVPSVVQLAPNTDDGYVVGAPARSSALTYHDRTALEFKRLMGSGEGIRLAEKTLTPESVASTLLKHLRAAAENHLGTMIKDVVLSVPARFENDAREATRRAAEMAGLNVVRLINEPTAAALAYGLDRLKENQRILVFDFGGGTLDVSILEMFEGVLDVKTSVGDDKLGGKDIDDIVANMLRDGYKEQHDKKLPPPSRDRKLAQLLKDEAEQYKKMLSEALHVEVNIPALASSGGLQMRLSQEDLEDRLNDLLMRAMMLVNEALSRARLRWDEIDVVLPVGGSSRVPIFRRALEMAWGHPVEERTDPDEAVARGAAIAAGIERGVFDHTDQDIMILDVSPHRLGVATIKKVGPGQFVDDYFSEIIPKDAKLPAIQKREYATQFHGSDPIDICIYEATGDGSLCRDHRLISRMPLRNLNGSKNGEPVQIEFRYTLDGTLEVAARYVSAPVIKVEGKFQVSGAGSVEAPDGTPRRWQDAAQADVCAPLLEQAARMERENPSIREAAEGLRRALCTGDEEEIRGRMDALTDQLFELA